MKRITAIDFKNAVKLDPAWAAKLTKPVEITRLLGKMTALLGGAA